EADRQDVSNIGRRTLWSRGSDDTLPWRSRGSDDTLPWRSGRTLDTLSRRTLRPDDTHPWRSWRPRGPWRPARALRAWPSRAGCRAPSGGRRRADTVRRCHRHGAPQSGRGRVQLVAPASRSTGAELICSTHHPERSWLNAEAPLNIRIMPVTDAVSQPLMSWLNAAAPGNIALMLVTDEVSQPLMSWLNTVARQNIPLTGVPTDE